MTPGTPTPWHIWISAADNSVNIAGPNNEFVALIGRAGTTEEREKMQADAATIIWAVNRAAGVGP